MSFKEKNATSLFLFFIFLLKRLFILYHMDIFWPELLDVSILHNLLGKLGPKGQTMGPKGQTFKL